jgi:hypothetical protein
LASPNNSSKSSKAKFLKVPIYWKQHQPKLKMWCWLASPNNTYPRMGVSVGSFHTSGNSFFQLEV